MISSNISGAAAYQAVVGGLDGGGIDAGNGIADGVGSGVGTGAPAGGSFTAALEGAITNLSNLGHDADAKSVQALSGGGNLTDVVLAVSKAEMALQASVAVRDKVISAYQDIMRMAV